LDRNIEGVYSHEHGLYTTDFYDIDSWLNDPKLIVKKIVIYAEMYLQLNTRCTIIQLYQAQKEFCNHHHLKLEIKKIDIEYMKKIGFIVGSNV